MTRDVDDKVRESVVKVFTQSDAPDYDQPWQTKGVVSSAGSGLIIATNSGPQVLTNAHVVANHVFIEVRRYGWARKFEGRVTGVGHACDLALLAVDDEAFLKGLKPMSMGGLPFIGEEVTALGYPIGGDRLSLTRGIVSRIEMAAYAHSQRRLLSVQIDAAINPGNSGGPVINRRGRVVGVSFQGLDEGENIGYMIGSPVVEHFLHDVANGNLDGFPDLGVLTQELRSATHRRSLGLPEAQEGGIRISKVVYGGSAWGMLEKGDVLLKLGRYPVSSDGTVMFRRQQRIHYTHLVAQRQVGDVLRIRFWRDGTMGACGIHLKKPSYLVPEDRYDVRPTYFIYGGIVFVPLTRDYLRTWGSEWWSNAPSTLMAIYEGDVRTPTRSEIVVLQKVLADRINLGYHDLESLVVDRVQGKPVRSTRHMISIIEGAREPFVRFDMRDGTAVVLDREVVEGQGAVLLERFGIRSDRSADLVAPADS